MGGPRSSCVSDGAWWAERYARYLPSSGDGRTPAKYLSRSTDRLVLSPPVKLPMGANRIGLLPQDTQHLFSSLTCPAYLSSPILTFESILRPARKERSVGDFFFFLSSVLEACRFPSLFSSSGFSSFPHHILFFIFFPTPLLISLPCHSSRKSGGPFGVLLFVLPTLVFSLTLTKPDPFFLFPFFP